MEIESILEMEPPPTIDDFNQLTNRPKSWDLEQL